jgi:hypothetical protein
MKHNQLRNTWGSPVRSVVLEPGLEAETVIFIEPVWQPSFDGCIARIIGLSDRGLVREIRVVY